jgi:hypothetical protein
MALAPQKTTFLLKNDIFAPQLLVGIVYNQDFHSGSLAPDEEIAGGVIAGEQRSNMKSLARALGEAKRQSGCTFLHLDRLAGRS